MDKFCAYIPLAGYDQDAQPVADDRYMVVCDGLGGDGGTVHCVGGSESECRKSAYIGSRKVSQIVSDFYSRNYDAFMSPKTIDSALAALKETIVSGLNACLEENPVKGDIVGGIFPTTLASALFRKTANGVDAVVIWAGDSRAYVFDTAKGLQQLSKDDVHGEFDACFGKDCRMSNCISQDQDFRLNYMKYKLPAESVLFVCSDGCFDFMESPVHFEILVMKALIRAAETDGISQSFSNVISTMKSGDDCTVAGAVFSEDYNGFRRLIEKRFRSTVAPMRNKIEDGNAKHDKMVEESKPEIRRLSSEIKNLNGECRTEIQNSVLEIFRYDYSGVVPEKFSGIVEKFRAYGPYSEYLSKSEEEKKLSRERVESSRRALAEAAKNAEIKRLVMEQKTPRRVSSRRYVYNSPSVYDNSRLMIVDENNSVELKNFKIKAQQLEETIHFVRTHIGFNFEDLREDFTVKMDELIISLVDLKNASERSDEEAMRKVEETVNADYIENEVIPFIISNGITRYRACLSNEEYNSLVGAFGTFRHFSEEAADEKKQRDDLIAAVNGFKNNFLRFNIDALSKIIKDDENASEYIPSLPKLKESSDKLAGLSEEIKNAEDDTKKVWSEYRIGYEAYKNCIGRGEV